MPRSVGDCRKTVPLFGCYFWQGYYVINPIIEDQKQKNKAARQAKNNKNREFESEE